MDFVLWLVMFAPSGKTISPDTAGKYVSEVQAWHQRTLGYRIGGAIEYGRLRALFKGLRRDVPSKPKKQRYGLRTQDLAAGLKACFSDGSNASAMWRAALTAAFAGLMRGGEIARQDGQRFDTELHLTRADMFVFMFRL